MKIVTLTLCPAFDVHACADVFRAEEESLATVTSREAGGKGLNISRALAADSVDSLAFLLLGRENAAEFQRMIPALSTEVVLVPGRIRENITLHVPDRPETRLSFRGFTVEEDTVKTVLDRVEALLGPGDLVTVTGRLPDGLSKEAVKAMLLRLKARGVRCVIDSRSFALSDLLECRPFLIKPNEEEIAAYTGISPDDLPALCAKARAWHGQGLENVMISLGKKGALLVCREGAFLASPPALDVVSTVGAGDSSIAGFLAAFSRGQGAKACLRTAVAFGSGACLQAGTLPPEKADVDRLRTAVRVTDL